MYKNVLVLIFNIKELKVKERSHIEKKGGMKKKRERESGRKEILGYKIVMFRFRSLLWKGFLEII